MTFQIGLAHVVDLVIVLTLLECAVLALHHRFSGAGVAPREIGLNLLSGLCLMLALRCAVHDAAPGWVAMWLLVSGLAHATDMVRRWQRAPHAPHRNEGVLS